MVSKKEIKKGVLYAAFDESNHSRGDIIVGVFSINPEDIHEDKHVRRNYKEVREFLSENDRDYRVAILSTLSDFYQTKYNLYLVAPFMIRDFLKSKKSRISKLRLIFDGPSRKKWEKILKSDLIEFESINTSNFWGRKKRRNYPLLLNAADVTASEIYRGSCKDALTHKKIIQIPLEELLRRKKLFEIF